MAGLIHGSAYADGPTATISIGDIVGNQNITRKNSGGASFYVPITIDIENAETYTVSFWADNANLCLNGTCSEGIRKIEPVGTSGSSFSNMPDDHWGARYHYGDTAFDDTSQTYHKMPTVSDKQELLIADSNTVTGHPHGNESKVLTLGYAASVSSDLPAGEYKNNITVAVVATPLNMTLHNSFLQNMQDDNIKQYCAGTTTPDSNATLYDDDGSHDGDAKYIPRTMLKDTRDDHMYIVEKLADGNCWMTENLALSSGTTEATRRTITSEDSNVTSDYKLPISSTSGFSSATAQNMYNGTETAGVNANYIFGFSALTTAQKTAKMNSLYNTTSHTGSYYTWLTAVAGNKGGANGDGARATEDICPKGWQLPTGQATTGDFTKLYKKYTNKTNFDQVWHMVNNNSYVGYYLNSALASSATRTVWWSRTSVSDASAYSLDEYTSGSINPSNNNYRLRGFSIRCVAK